jgi:hypothetical protein
MYISTYYKRNATLERNDGRTTAFVAPDDKFDPFGALTNATTMDLVRARP